YQIEVAGTEGKIALALDGAEGRIGAWHLFDADDVAGPHVDIVRRRLLDMIEIGRSDLAVSGQVHHGLVAGIGRSTGSGDDVEQSVAAQTQRIEASLADAARDGDDGSYLLLARHMHLRLDGFVRQGLGDGVGKALRRAPRRLDRAGIRYRNRSTAAYLDI